MKTSFSCISSVLFLRFEKMKMIRWFRGLFSKYRPVGKF